MDDYVDRKHRLSSVEMARFVRDGFLRIDAAVPDDLNARAIAELDAGLEQFPYGTPLPHVHAAGTAIGDILRLPVVAGALHSLVGPHPTGDHQYFHVRGPRETEAQVLHADAVFDTRGDAFDVQLMYYPQPVGPADGGTLLVPGTHFRRVHNTEIARYQNLRGQVRLSCPAGTVLFLHHGLWHAGRRNDSATRRLMFKLRVNPTVRQLRLWNTDDIDDPVVEATLMEQHPWSGNEGRLEQMNRARFWRFLTGDEDFDLDYYWTRSQLRPTRIDTVASDRRLAAAGTGQGFELHATVQR